MEGQRADGLLVVCERAHGLALANVPQLDCVVMRARDDLGSTVITCTRHGCASYLRVECVGDDGSNCVCVASHAMHLRLGPDVPQLGM